MASGKVPFDADNFMGILTQHMYKSPVPIRALVPAVDVPPGLDAIILKSLTKKPEGRYATMNDVVADLEKLERGILPDAVQEMMARSGGFNVPADYFRSSAMPAPVPASPAGIPHRSRLPLYAAIGVVATVIGAGAIVLVAKSGAGNAQTNAPSGASSQVAPPPPSTSVGAAIPPPKPIAMKSTALVASPLKATITRGDQALKNPAAIEVPEGTTVDLVVTLDGYTSQTVTLNAGESKSITLLKTPATLPTGKLPPGKPTTTTTTTTPTQPPPPKPPGPKCDPDDPFCKH
jgi:serine/threonine-protein kinase